MVRAEMVNPQAVVDMLERLGGTRLSSGLVCVLDESVGKDAETFVITSRDGKPCVKGNTMSALTTGINWYLNHYAKVNVAWNNLGEKIDKEKLPIPIGEEMHTCDAQYRYYLNYCTFSYSMATWTWDRWQQEIDWMALHGINTPLQIIGLDALWYNLLTQDYHYTHDEANNFIAGPAFQAWWGMNNLEGWGGPNPSWWYERQTQLAKKIVQRERELGITPVLPGFSGMVPHDFAQKTGYSAESQGGWCGFQRPFIMDPTTNDFALVAKQYYKRLNEIMGKSKYYSMDPFHEGGHISSGKYREGYRAIFDAMNDNCGNDTKWVIQQWQWSQYQAQSLTAVPERRLIVLDLFSDGQPSFDNYSGYYPQEAVYCAIPNFGGRTGFFGRIPKMADNYFEYKAKYKSIRGIGAAPEAIEQTPVVYDLLFELPWMGAKPNTDAWIANYATSRYGKENSAAQYAWTLLLNSALNNTTQLQGPHEAVICARPSLDVQTVSTWGGSEIFYNQNQLLQAARFLLDAKFSSSNANYSYDVVDIVRQVLTDHSKSMLARMKKYDEQKDKLRFIATRDSFLNIILDIDQLLGTNRNFRLGNWTERARAIADEMPNTTAADRDWLELNNARTLITTWGDRYPAEGGGLRDYSYREWQGMLSDYYYPRWRTWFEHAMQPTDGWFDMEWSWAHNASLNYSAKPQGSSIKVAKKLMKKYF